MLTCAGKLKTSPSNELSIRSLKKSNSGSNLQTILNKEVQMNALQEMIDHSRRVVFFGGAGVSVASGIPDFRGENGLYARDYDGLTAEMMLSHSFFFLHPDIFYDFYRKHMIYPQAKPNIVHRRLAQMEQAGKLTALVTQNIDGLHKQAGSRNVFELHGSIYENFCMGCGRRFPLSFIMNTSIGCAALSGLRRCRSSGGYALR